MKPYYEDSAVQLFLGDCREILPSLPSESVTLLWTDPPYGHGNQNGDLQSARVGVKGARQQKAEPIANDGQDSMRAVVDAMLTEAARILKSDCCCCCCCCCGGGGPKPSFAWLAERMDREGLAFFHSVIWDKTARGPGMGWRFRRDHEMLMVAHRQGGTLAWVEDTAAISNILRFQPPIVRIHPNEKPLDLVLEFVRITTLPGEMILDPFCGSGVALRTAKDLGRKAIGIEIDERYAEIAARRMGQEVLAL
jgi:site-specific DNA-methyltransferase (adenine-specific)